MSAHQKSQREPITGPNYWRAVDMANSEEWIYRLSDEAKAELDSAMRSVQRRGLEIPFTKDDFPLQGFATELQAISEELENGRGFVMIRGLDRDKYTKEEAGLIYWGIGTYLGTAVPQNAKGDLLGHVRNVGLDLDDPSVRAYQTSADINFHNDSSDVVGLLCLNKSRSGGASRLANVLEVHNQILEERPDLLDVLYEPFYIDRRGEPGRDDEEPKPYFAMPVFSYYKGRLSSRWTNFHYIESAQRFPEVPRMTDAQVEAMRFLGEVSERPSMHFYMQFEPGDMQFINNYPVVHSRTAYEDYEEMDKRRHLLRLWLSVPNSRPLHPVFAQRFGNVEAGAIRGGIAVRKSAQQV